MHQNQPQRLSKVENDRLRRQIRASTMPAPGKNPAYAMSNGYHGNAPANLHGNGVVNGGFGMPGGAHSFDGRRMWAANVRLNESVPSSLSEHAERRYNSIPGYGPSMTAAPYNPGGVSASIHVGEEDQGASGDRGMDGPAPPPPRPHPAAGVEVRSDMPAYADDDKSMHSMSAHGVSMATHFRSAHSDTFGDLNGGPQVPAKMWEESSHQSGGEFPYVEGYAMMGGRRPSAVIDVRDNALIKVPLGNTPVPIEIAQLVRTPSLESMTQAVTFEAHEQQFDLGQFEVEAKAYVSASVSQCDADM